ncbi:hypothetical protein AB6A23_17000 [Paenibacillus tarimensis]
MADDPPVPTVLAGQKSELSSPQQAYDLQKYDDTKAITPPDNSAKSPGTGETANSDGKGNQTTEAESNWNSDLPKLAGIAIGDSRNSIAEEHGKPTDSYSLKDNDETIYVDDYKGFSVGFESNKVKFIEVYEDSVSTGLGDVKIGMKEDAVLKELGKPSNHTTYVLSYQAEGALLKLDMDPKNREIVSIKLFKQ